MSSIEINAQSEYLLNQSRPETGQYVYAYTISITNLGNESAQLMSRHWFITDEKNQTREVQGTGVIGEQPIIEPGQSYTYSSGAVLETKNGVMMGSYTMRSPDGNEYTTEIPPFALVQTKALH